VSQEAPIELIKGVPLFADLDKKELQSLTRSFKRHDYAAGESIVSESEGPSRFFVIHDGTATVTVHGQARGTLGAGDYFGEIALIDKGVRTATITAETDVRLFGLTFWEFRPLVEENASIAWKLLQAMAKRVRELEARAD
jgi:CRP/FNR family cyclic AMP-dependent transcriptional regulator